MLSKLIAIIIKCRADKNGCLILTAKKPIKTLYKITDCYEIQTKER